MDILIKNLGNPCFAISIARPEYCNIPLEEWKRKTIEDIRKSIELAKQSNTNMVAEDIDPIIFEASINEKYQITGFLPIKEIKK